MSEPSDERYTPEHVLDVVRQFAPIGLDPCTTRDNITDAAFYFHLPEGEDTLCGLTRVWFIPTGTCAFINPPYSRGELPKWARKIVLESHTSRSLIALIPSDLGTEAGQIVAQTADAICFVKGRLTFGTLGEEPKITTGAKQPSIMPYWGADTTRFARIFAQLGVVWVR